MSAFGRPETDEDEPESSQEGAHPRFQGRHRRQRRSEAGSSSSMPPDESPASGPATQRIVQQRQGSRAARDVSFIPMSSRHDSSLHQALLCAPPPDIEQWSQPIAFEETIHWGRHRIIWDDRAFAPRGVTTRSPVSWMLCPLICDALGWEDRFPCPRPPPSPPPVSLTWQAAVTAVRTAITELRIGDAWMSARLHGRLHWDGKLQTFFVEHAASLRSVAAECQAPLTAILAEWAIALVAGAAITRAASPLIQPPEAWDSEAPAPLESGGGGSGVVDEPLAPLVQPPDAMDGGQWEW